MKKFILIPYTKYEKYKELEEKIKLYENKEKENMSNVYKDDKSEGHFKHIAQFSEAEQSKDEETQIMPPGIRVDKTDQTEQLTDEEHQSSESEQETEKEEPRNRTKRKKAKLSTLWEKIV